MLRNRPGDEPRVLIVGHPIAGPLFGGDRKGLVECLFGLVETAEQSNQRGKDASRLGAIGRLQRVARCDHAHSFGRGLLKSTSGRTSTEPIVA
jgi:hypothetical protein